MNNLSFRIARRLRKRLWSAIKEQYATKFQSTEQLVGCSYEQLLAYISSKFTEGMSWNNYGKWHIDHIRPCASFDLADHEQQKQCFHYTNLQPLWAIDNIKKGDSILL